MRRTALLLAGAAAVVAAPAAAREGQFYIGINGGVSFEDQVRVRIDNNRPDGLLEPAAFADTETGIDADLVIGYDFGPLRIEAEGGYKKAGYQGLTVVSSTILPGGITVPGGTVVENSRDLAIWSGMVNGLLEFGKDDGVQFFAGGGVGFANLDLPVEVAGVGTVIDDDKTDFAWQLLAGARLAVSENVDLGLKYRYFVADNFDLVAANNRPIVADYRAHALLASLTYNFGGRPACNTGPFIVFFEFDRSDITPEAASILNGAATAYANCGMARVMLAGHTDRAGTPRYNLGLAERRNMAVREYLVARGIPAGRIAAEAFGEAQPRVPTADGVREAQNRRVEVTYGPGSGM